jgi:hypothetical protein
MRREMQTLHWVLRRWLPAMGLAVMIGAVTGAFRAGAGFLVGIAGMLAMGILG